MTVAHHRTYKISNDKIILLLMTAVVSLAGGIWTYFRQEQGAKLQQAQAQLSEVCLSNIHSEGSAAEASRKVDESSELLYSIPQIPGGGYQTAQDQLASFAPCIQRVKKIEDVYTAQRISQNALTVNSNTVLSVPEWQKLKSNLEQSIALLNGIPEDIDIYTEAQQNLRVYQTQLEEVNRGLASEAGYEQALTNAEQLAAAANTLLATPPDDKALSEAETYLQSAIGWLETIPQGHRVSAKSQDNLVAYHQQLTSVRYQRATQQLKELVDDFYKFTVSLDSTLTYHTYSEQLNYFTDRFHALKDAPETLNHPATKALQTALKQCNDALIVWRYCHEGNCYDSWAASILDLRRNILWIPAYFQLGDSSLEQAYPIPIEYNIWMYPYVQQNLALSMIWDYARQNAAIARDAI